MTKYEDILLIQMHEAFLKSGTFQCQRCGRCCTVSKNIKHSPKDKFRVLKTPCEYYDAEKKACTQYKDRPKVCRIYPFIVKIQQGSFVTLSLHGACPECRRIAKVIGCEISEYEKKANS